MQKLPVVESKKLKKGDVVIGQGSTEGLTEDGFRLADGDGILYISSGGDKGTLNGVVQLLEDYLGVQYYAADAYTLDRRSTVDIPAIGDRVVNPAFRYRQSQCYAMQEDPIYRIWMRFEEPSDEFCRRSVGTYIPASAPSGRVWRDASGVLLIYQRHASSGQRESMVSHQS